MSTREYRKIWTDNGIRHEIIENVVTDDKGNITFLERSETECLVNTEPLPAMPEEEADDDDDCPVSAFGTISRFFKRIDDKIDRMMQL